MICSKSKARIAALEAENAMLRQWLDSALKDADFAKERAEQATNALLAYQQKPVVQKPANESERAAFIDKNLSFFRDEDGGEEAA